MPPLWTYNHLATKILVRNEQETFDYYCSILGFKEMARKVVKGERDWAKMERLTAYYLPLGVRPPFPPGTPTVFRSI